MTDQVTKMKVLVTADTTQADEAAKRSAQKLKDSYKISASNLARQNSQDSGTARGLGGLTGASARDFASQSQGLGGVVRLYATFAANLFAASAAFGALSRAADTTNMVKGLDQLGAASGRALGSLSKQLVAVTDGAINLREAMTATALASSGGMTNQAILRMGEVAKQASQALGVAMPDAISRLSRGITKLEPELLDEIGIMVRVDRTSQDYAASIGKSAAALTDFEKRQAFANAVLEQGEKKFGAIKIDANPYSKILASMENIAQKGLELINTVFSPLLTILSSSPTALAASMAGVAAILLKQAVPALGSFKEALRISAENSTKMSNLRSIEAKKAALQEVVNARQAAEAVAEVRLAAVDKNVADQQKLLARSKFKQGSAIGNIFEKASQDLTEKDFGKIEAQAKAAATKGNEALAKTYRDGAIALRQSIAAETAYAEVVKRTTAEIAKRQSMTTTAGQFQKIVDKENLASISRNITSRAAETAATNSFGKAWKDASEEIRKARSGPQIIEIADGMGNITKQTVPAMGAMQSFWTMTKVGAVSAISAIGTALSAFMGWIAIIGFAIGVLGSFVSWMSTSEKETEKLSIALTGLNDAAENASKTIDNLSTKSFSETLDPKSIQARATAFLEVSESINKTAQSYRNLLNAQSGSDKAVESFFSFFGRGDSDKLAKSLGVTISNSLELLASNPEARKSAEQALNNLFGKNIDIKSPQSLIQALKGMTDGKLSETANAISALFKRVSTDVNNAASNLTSFTESLAATSKLVGESNAKLTPQDENGKFGAGLISQGLLLSKILEEGPIQSLAAMNSLISDTKSLSLLPPKAIEQLTGASEELRNIQAKLGENSKLQIQAEKALSSAIEARRKNNPNENAINDYLNPELVDAITAQKNIIKELKKESQQLSSNASEAVSVASKGISAAIFDAGAKRLTMSLESAMVSAAVVAGGAYLSVLKGIGGDTAAEEGKLRMVEISAQRSVIEATYANIQATTKLELTMREAAANLKLETAKNTSGGNLEGRSTAITAANKELEAVARERAIVIQKDPAKSLKALSSPETTKEDRDAFAAQSGFVQSLIGYKSQMAALDAKAYASNITQMAQAEGERVKNKQKEYDDLNKTLNLRKSNIDMAQKLSGTYDAGLAASAKQVELEIVKNDSLKIQAELEGKINIAKKLGNNKEAQKASKKAQEDISREQLSLLQKNKEIESKYTTEKIAGEATLFKLQEERNTLERNNLYETKLLGLNIQEQTLKYAKEIGVVDSGIATLGLADIAIQRQELSYKKELADLTSKELLDLQAKQSTLDKIKANNSIIPAEGQIGEFTDPAEAQSALDAATKAYADQKANLDAKNASTITELQLTAERNAMQEVFNDQLKTTADITTSLTSLFGEMGANIGGAATALTKFAQMDEEYLRNKLKLENEFINAAEGSKEETAAKDKLAKLEKKYAKDQLTNISNVANASKKMFKEETGAYKVLDGVEKAAHAYKMAVMVQENATKLGLMASEVIASVTANGTIALSAVPGALLKFVQQLGWPGVAAGAAFVASLGLGGGSGASGYSGPSVEDIQTNQNTGMSFIDGKFQENGSGVFGDSSAKSESITRSLEIIADTSVRGMSYSNKTVDLLTAIKDNTSQAATALYGVQGIRSGSALGTKEGGSSNPGFLGAFASSSSTTIDNTGIKLGGTFANAVVNGFETVTESKSNSGLFGLFSSSSSSTSNRAFALPPGAESAIQEVFTNAGKLFKDQGEKLGTDIATVDKVLSSFSLEGKEASLKGLSGEDLTNALNALISSSIDEVSKQLFPEVEKFKQFGEGFFETVTRVVDNSEKVSQAFASIGSANTAQTLKTGTEKLAIELPLALTKATGGLSEFISLTEDFTSSFLTDLEQLAPQAVMLNKELTGLGYSAAMTRTEFKNLITGFKVTDEASAGVYATLLKLAPAMDSVIGYVEQLTGLTSTSLSDLFRDGLLGRLDASELGKQVSEKIEEGIYNAVSTGFADQISSMFVDQVVNPMVMAILTGGAVTEAVSKQTLDNIVKTATASAEALSTLFQDAGFIAALDAIKTAVGAISKAGTNVTNKPYTYEAKKEDTKTITPLKDNIPELDKAKGMLLKSEGKILEGNLTLQHAKNKLQERELSAVESYNQAMFLANKVREEEIAILNERLGLQNELNSLTDTAAQATERQREALSESNRALFDQIQNIKNLNAVIAAMDSAVEGLLNTSDLIKYKIQRIAASLKGTDFDKIPDLANALSNLSIEQIQKGAIAFANTIGNSSADVVKVLDAASKLIAIRSQQQSQLQALRDEASQKYVDKSLAVVEAQKTLVGLLTSAVDSLQEVVDSLNKSNDPKENLRLSKDRVDLLISQAKKGDSKAIEKIPDAVNTYLEQAKALSKSSTDYVRETSKIRNSLSGIIASGKAAIESVDQTGEIRAELAKDPIAAANDAVLKARQEQFDAAKEATAMQASLTVKVKTLGEKYVELVKDMPNGDYWVSVYNEVIKDFKDGYDKKFGTVNISAADITGYFTDKIDEIIDPVETDSQIIMLDEAASKSVADILVEKFRLVTFDTPTIGLTKAASEALVEILEAKFASTVIEQVAFDLNKVDASALVTAVSSAIKDMTLTSAVFNIEAVLSESASASDITKLVESIGSAISKTTLTTAEFSLNVAIEDAASRGAIATALVAYVDRLEATTPVAFNLNTIGTADVAKALVDYVGKLTASEPIVFNLNTVAVGAVGAALSDYVGRLAPTTPVAFDLNNSATADVAAALVTYVGKLDATTPLALNLNLIAGSGVTSALVDYVNKLKITDPVAFNLNTVGVEAVSGALVAYVNSLEATSPIAFNLNNIAVDRVATSLVGYVDKLQSVAPIAFNLNTIGNERVTEALVSYVGKLQPTTPVAFNLNLFGESALTRVLGEKFSVVTISEPIVPFSSHVLSTISNLLVNTFAGVSVTGGSVNVAQIITDAINSKVSTMVITGGGGGTSTTGDVPAGFYKGSGRYGTGNLYNDSQALAAIDVANQEWDKAGITNERIMSTATQWLNDSDSRSLLNKYGVGDGLGGIRKFDVGTNYVPQDMLAMLHEGEAVVPKEYNPSADGGNNNELIRQLINKMDELQQEVKQLRSEQFDGNMGNIRATKDITRLLRDVSNNGTSITTTAAT